MNLVNHELYINLQLEENKINLLVIENKKLLRDIISELSSQCEGNDGNFVLADNNKILKINKECAFITDPFTIKLNDKKILTKLHNYIKEEVEEYLIEESTEINAQITSYLDKAINLVPYSNNFKFEFDILGLLKLYNVELEAVDTSFMEQLVEYLRALKELCKYKVIFLLNIRQFLEEADLKLLYEFSIYNKINLILIESTFISALETEKVTIIDKDLCTIIL